MGGYKTNKPQLVVLAGDEHVGSSMGLLHAGFVTHEGQAIGQNPLQKWFSKSWDDCWKWARQIIGKDEWVFVNNGDAMDGNHHGTKEIWAVDETDHLNAAKEILLDVAADAAAVYIVEGTESHTRNLEHALAKMLKADGVNVITPKGNKGAWETLRLRVSGTICEFDHHMPTVGRSYNEASALSAILGDIRNQRSRSGQDTPQVIVRSHRHRFGLYDDGYGMMVALPAWQGLTRFGRKVVAGTVPQCGLVILDWRNAEYAGTPTVHKRLHTIKTSSVQVA